MFEQNVGVRISGGLGNQLFQFAAAYTLARRLGTRVRCDLTAIEADRLRRFEMQPIFSEYFEFFPSYGHVHRFLDRVSRVWACDIKTGHRFGLPIFVPNDYGWDPRFDDLSKPVYLMGYFLSHKYTQTYWQEYARVIQKFLNSFSDLIQATFGNAFHQAVSVHVRRGDKSADSALSRRFAQLDRSHYRTAMQVIESRLISPYYYVFSDDITSAREMLPIRKNMRFVTGNSAIQDLALMSQCQHHIIANSTYSWWGASLGETQYRGMVVAPNDYYADGSPPPRDFLRRNWIII